MAQEKKTVHISSKQLYIGTIISYLVALIVYIAGWIITGPHLIALFCCLPLVFLTPSVFQKRRRFYQLTPNLLVIYICWSLAERFINPEFQTYAAISLVAWAICLTLMLLLVRTSFLIDGGHYVPDPEKKLKRQERKAARLAKKLKKQNGSKNDIGN